MKYTSTDHPDHPLIVEVSGALFDLFEQVNVDNFKKVRYRFVHITTVTTAQLKVTFLYYNL